MADTWSDQDVRVNGVSIMQKTFWISRREGLDTTPGFRSTNFEVAYLQGTSWREKQLPEVVRTLTMTVDACDDTGAYPVGRANRVAQFNSNLRTLLQMFARENAQVVIERDVLLSDGAGGSTLETWTGYAQATNPVIPEFAEDFDDCQFTIDLLFADPVWYGADATTSVSGSTTITNPGDIDATALLLTFSGGANYRLTNNTTDPVTWVQIDRSGAIVIDVRNGTAFKDGNTNVIGFLSHDGARQFMRIVPGANSMTLTGGGSVTVSYKVPRT